MSVRHRLERWHWDGIGFIGEVYNSERPDGKPIRTSKVDCVYHDADGTLLADTQTKTYELGEVHPQYEANYPNAIERLIRSFMIASLMKEENNE